MNADTDPHEQRALGLLAAGVLAFSVLYALLELGRIAGAVGTGTLLIAVVATLIFLPLHLRHLHFGMRGQRPPRGGLTLLVMAITEVAALFTVGPSWALMLGALAASAMIVLSPRWSLLLVAVCVLGPEVRAALAGSGGDLFGPYRLHTGFYLDMSYIILVVALGQFSLVWLLAAANHLRLSRSALTAAAAERERQRIQTRLQTSLSSRLNHMLEVGRDAHAATIADEGVAAPVVVLDRLVESAQGALADLRRIVADARTPAGRSATHGLVQAARRSRTPVGRALTIDRARLAAWLQYALWFGFSPLFALGAFGRPFVPGSVPVILAAAAALAVLQVWLVLEVMRGERPRRPTWGWLLMLVLWPGLLPLGGMAWESAGFLVAAAALLSFRGYRRMIPVVALAVFLPIYDAIVVLPHLHHLGAFATAVQLSGDVFLAVFAPAGLAASALLVATVRKLERVRDQLAEHAANLERRRLSSDAHDILGQSLTAVSLKASVARELLLAGNRTGAATELTELLELAEEQTSELEAIARNERQVELNSELAEAVRLLRAAGIAVNVHVGLTEFDERTSSLLGWAVREGTTNILRHAKADLCEIELRRSNQQIELALLNNGARPAVHSGTGLAGLAERLAAAHGTAHAEALPDGRFQLRIELPA